MNPCLHTKFNEFIMKIGVYQNIVWLREILYAYALILIAESVIGLEKIIPDMGAKPKIERSQEKFNED